MQIKVNFDTSVLDRTAKRYEKNLAFSTAQAINDSAKEAQRRIRASLRAAFHVRKSAFLDRAIKIFAFASVGQNRVYAELGIDNKPRLLLSMFQTGGARLPFVGKSQAVPISGQVARPSVASSVNPAYEFGALHFSRGPITQAGRKVLTARKAAKDRKRRLSGNYYVWQGGNRTFILQQSKGAPFGGVFQRIGPKSDDLRLIYSFRRSVQLKKALSFIEIAQQTYEEVFKDTFVRKFFRI